MLGLPAIAPVYMDYAATTPVAPEVVAAMQANLVDSQAFANPSSTHEFGERAAAAVARARAQIAAALGVADETLVFTSGATESDNLAIIGAARYRRDQGRHLVTSRVEHKAVIDAFRQLEREGFEVTWLTPDADGRIGVDALRDALRDDTTLVSLMWVNNETGVINDIAGLGQVVAAHTALFHVDAAQAFGKLPMPVAELPIDLLSLTAHKCYGPKGIGALYIATRDGVNIEPLLHGGGQQRRLRPGTLPTHQIVGFGEAAALAARVLDEDRQRLAALGQQLTESLLALPGVLLNGSRSARLPWLVNVSVDGVDGESLRAAMRPVAVASGSACNSTSAEPSFVLRALGRSDALAGASLRFSLGRETDATQVAIAAARFRAAVTALRRVAGPLLRDTSA